MDQSKMEKLLRLLMMLNSGRNYSIDELRTRMGVSQSTIYRYLDTFDEAGFAVDRCDGRYRLQAEEKNVRSLNQLFHFSEEEAWTLYQTLSLFEQSSPVKEKLVNKLHHLYDFRMMAETEHKSRMQVLAILYAAIEEKRTVRLVDYRSSNSDSIGSRLVEPFKCLDDSAAIWCFALGNHQCKQFRIARMDGVELLSERWRYENEHRVPFCDAFRLSSPAPIATITASLSLKAYNLIIEEFPLSQQWVTPCANSWWLEIPVASYHGIGRFVLGLPEEVNVEGPEEFLCFLEKKREMSYLDLPPKQRLLKTKL